jgi:antitoxin component of MazEF toxin-antitoxin module
MTPKKDVRKVFKLGQSLAITLPSEYVKRKNIREGDLVEIYFDDLIHIKPVDLNELAERVEKAKDALTK